MMVAVVVVIVQIKNERGSSKCFLMASWKAAAWLAPANSKATILWCAFNEFSDNLWWLDPWTHPCTNFTYIKITNFWSFVFTQL